MEEMKKNVEAAQHISFEAEQKLCSFSGRRRQLRQRQRSRGDTDDKMLAIDVKLGYEKHRLC